MQKSLRIKHSNKKGKCISGKKNPEQPLIKKNEMHSGKKERTMLEKKAHKEQNAKKGWRSLKKSEKKAKYIFGKNNIVEIRYAQDKYLLNVY